MEFMKTPQVLKEKVGNEQALKFWVERGQTTLVKFYTEEAFRHIRSLMDEFPSFATNYLAVKGCDGNWYLGAEPMLIFALKIRYQDQCDTIEEALDRWLHEFSS